MNVSKEKQVEEMAKVIDDRLIEARNYLGSMNKGEGYWIAQKLVEHYQPKINDNEVVISKKEYERLKSTINRLRAYDKERDIALHANLITKTRKETTKKILKEFDALQENLSKKIIQLKEPFNRYMNSKEKEGYEKAILSAKSVVTSFKSRLAKQFDLEKE